MSAADGAGGTAVEPWLHRIGANAKATLRDAGAAAAPRRAVAQRPRICAAARRRRCRGARRDGDARWLGHRSGPAAADGPRRGLQPAHGSGQGRIFPLAARACDDRACLARHFAAAAADAAPGARSLDGAARLCVHRHRAAGPVRHHRQAADRPRPAAGRRRRYVRLPAVLAGRSTMRACRPAMPPRPLRRWSRSARSFPRRGR